MKVRASARGVFGGAEWDVSFSFECRSDCGRMEAVSQIVTEFHPFFMSSGGGEIAEFFITVIGKVLIKGLFEFNPVAWAILVVIILAGMFLRWMYLASQEGDE